MRKLWYVSVALASTAAATRRMHCRPSTRNLAGALLPVAWIACAGPSATGNSAATPGGAPDTPIQLEQSGARDANLAGARCKQGAPCKCRDRLGGDAAEAPPPDDQHKRFEIRLAGSGGGGATLDSPTLGHFAALGDEACFYIDVLPGTTSDVTFTAREGRRDAGVAPVLDIAEYGPKGPWWYDIFSVRCAGPNGKCNRDAADAWSEEAKGRRRGRVDPCGSAVISRMVWDTSGGVGNRELGLFRDLTLKFTLDVKRFPTQHPPRAKECVPK